MKYKFEQFKIEIEPTSIEVDLNTIRDKAIDKTITVDVILIADGCRYGIHAEDMPYVDSWSDEDVYGMVVEWLEQFKID